MRHNFYLLIAATCIVAATAPFIYDSSDSEKVTPLPSTATRPPGDTRASSAPKKSELPGARSISGQTSKPQTVLIAGSIVSTAGSDSLTGRSVDNQLNSERLPPQTLDDFRPIGDEEGTPQSDEVVVKVGHEQEYKFNHAVLKRSLDVLRSEQTHLHSDAMNELADMTDPSAGQGLIEAVARSAGIDADYRFRAVAALARHAEVTQFSDLSAVFYLKQLVSDTDTDVRSIAAQSLLQMERARISVEQTAAPESATNRDLSETSNVQQPSF